MKLSQFAEHIKNKEADVRGYANDRSRADDPLIQPFAALQEQRERLLDLQRSTLSSCWINEQRKLIPFDIAGFNQLQNDIKHLQEAISHNALVLDELERAVEDMYIDQMSLGILRMERAKALEEITFLKSQPDKDLAHKWKAVLEVGGSREMYEKLPETIAARAEADAKIAPLLERIKTLEHQIKSLESILSKFIR